MILFKDALHAVLQEAVPTGQERVPMMESPGRVLAEDIFSDTDMPPFDKSAVDGFACRREDLSHALELTETIAAGTLPSGPLPPMHCARIMTGAMLPEGADCVFMVEHSEDYAPGLVRFTGRDTANNICYRGEDIRRGDKVLEAGTFIRPRHIAVLATVGATRPLVSKRPLVSVIATGDELVTPSEKPAGSMIRNSNSYQLEAQVNEAGATAKNLGIIADSQEGIRERLSQAMEDSDLTLLTGGVSMGDFDYVPEIMKSAGIDILFRTIAIQPGKPTVFGKKGDKLVFGLPGNPVSSFVLFEILVKPLIFAMMRRKTEDEGFVLPAGQEIRRKRAERQAFVPVRIRNGEIFPLEYHGSAHINAYVPANGIISIPIGEQEIKKGALVHVRPV